MRPGNAARAGHTHDGVDLTTGIYTGVATNKSKNGMPVGHNSIIFCPFQSGQVATKNRHFQNK